MTHHVDLTTIRLLKGSHAGEDGGCLLEWTAIFAGEDKSDHPACTSPVLAAFGIAFNDGVDDETRQRLVPYIPRLVGTSGDRQADDVRAWMATDWLVRTFTPAWLRQCGLGERADELGALLELTSTALAKAAQPIIDRAREEAAAAGAAAWDAAGDAAWDAAGQKKGYEAQYAAARKAADAVIAEKLGETIVELREDALRLFDRMIDVRVAVPA